MQGNRHAHTRVLRWAVLASLVSAREIVEEPHAVALSVSMRLPQGVATLAMMSMVNEHDLPLELGALPRAEPCAPGVYHT